MEKGSEKYLQLKASLQKQGRLYEDPEFPAGPSSLGPSRSTIVLWKRPQEIVANPKFVVDDANRCDLNQGNLQDCWFIAATACLATTHQGLLARCVPHDQEFDSTYAGIFRFNFWHFDQWVEVIIDDRLPTISGQLIYGSNKSQPNEFWVPLFEKAYAKLYGSYSNLEGGFTNNALVDFTGGISEFIDIRPIRKTSDSLYDKMYFMMQKSSMIGSHIEATRIPEKPLPSGLYSGHAYSVTNLVRLKVKGSTIRLLRLRNPWGKGEWNGAWSDSSKEWASTPDKIKQEVGMVKLEDGEFWMSFEDWLNNFEFLTICHLDPEADTLEQGTPHKDRETWNVETHHAEWLKGFNAGGCGNPPNERQFWSNPQFCVSISGQTVHTDGKNSMIVSLMQKTVTQKCDSAISFSLFKLKEGVPLLLNGKNYDQSAMLLAKSAATFLNLREVTCHYDVEPGNYVIIPCTYKPNEKGEFLLRIYTEEVAKSEAIDVATTILKPSIIEDAFQEVFSRSTSGDVNMEPKEFMNALNEILLKDTVTMKIGIYTARDLLAMIDKDQTGLMNVDEFRQLVKEVQLWKDKFRVFDRDRSGSIDTYELAQVFDSIGFQISRHVLQSMVRRFAGKSLRLTFEDFVHCCSKIVNLFNQFTKLSSAGITGKVELTLEEWLATTIYY